MFRRLLKLPLHWQILGSLALAVLCGQLTRMQVGVPNFGFVTFLGIPVAAAYDFIGHLFLRALQMLVVPLIASAIITGIGGLAQENAFGRMGIKTMSYYFCTTLLAVLTGLLMVNLIKPGVMDGESTARLFGLKADASLVEQRVGGRDAGDIVQVFERMIPANVIDTATENSQMLGLIFFCLIFGYFMTRLEGEPARVLAAFWQGVYDVMLKITDLVMKFAPVGVFGLVAKVSASTSPEDFSSLFLFFITVLIGLAIHMFISLPLLLRWLGGIRPSLHFRAMFPSLITAFSTSSSNATLPVTMECLEKNAGVSNRTASFVTPLGATINMDGTALYECVAVMFIAQVYGADLGLGTQVITVVLALLTSIGVAGVPSASLVAIVVILAALNIPAEAIGLLMVFDRLLDMCRTSVNVFSDTCGAAIIARSEGESVDYPGVKYSS